MLDKENKDQIIAFLKERIEKIVKIAKEHDENSPWFYDSGTNGYEMIEDLAEKTLMDTTW